jgi:hypothetical protein
MSPTRHWTSVHVNHHPDDTRRRSNRQAPFSDRRALCLVRGSGVTVDVRAALFLERLERRVEVAPDRMRAEAETPASCVVEDGRPGAIHR